LAIELDKLKPFAQIVGDDEGRAFEQNGRYFTGSGQLWAPPEVAPAPAAPAEASEPPTRARRIRTSTTAEPPAAPPSEADAQIAAQLGGQQG
jgi:hypothetical protein